MKKFAIFISYSRKDYWDKNKNVIPDNLVSQIVERLDAYKEYYDFEYFFDLEDITSAHDYLKRISKAILDSEVLLFVASKNSSTSEFCSKELLFADKKHKAIHQYRIEDFEMPDDIEMLLGNHHYREVGSFSVDRMVREVLANAMGCDITSIDIVRASSRVEVPQPISARIYKVGDLYDDGNGKKGVVFEVSADGKHGKIVSLSSPESRKLMWASNMFDSWCDYVGAVSETDGAVNLAAIKRVPNWRKKYPAFAWCADLGDDWYLPSINELSVISDHKDIINARLKVVDEITEEWYWSSNEYKKDGYWACILEMFKGNTGFVDKSARYYVRAVATF